MADLYERIKRFQKINQSKQEPCAPPSAEKKPASVPENLLNIPGVVRGNQLEKIGQERDDRKQRFLATLGVEERSNSAGTYGLREVCYPSRDLSFSCEDIAGRELVFLTRDPCLASLSPTDYLFIDTETTGLAGGTGTLPFLVGIGYFTEEGFLVRQYFMRDYDEEPAVLQELEAEISRFAALASYNGKGFDIPLLQSRFLLNRKRIPITEYPHLDLLFPARRLWKLCLPDCSLSSVEQGIFHKHRVDDIPGEQIPYVYFDFLRGTRMQRMRPVLNHNAEDIVSLAMLAAKVCRLGRNPFKEFGHGAELIGLGRAALAHGDFEQACACFENALEKGRLEADLVFLTQRHLSVLYKRLDLWEKAVYLWRKMIKQPNDCFAFIELAKYYEHKEKDLAEALFLTEEALRHMGCRELQWEQHQLTGNKIADELLHRRRRLLSKNKVKQEQIDS
ncbi:hypothetical protein GF373_07870 [bacterium]|nr:hypothetical protein [bacterium]